MKYKAKMQPGAVKKGKGRERDPRGSGQFDSKVPKEIWNQKSEDPGKKIWPREADLIAGLKDVELIAVIPVGRVRVMMGWRPRGEVKIAQRRVGRVKGKGW